VQARCDNTKNRGSSQFQTVVLCYLETEADDKLGEKSMPSTKVVKLNLPVLGEVDAVEVGLTESVERWTELKLEDGSVLRIKPVVTTVLRLEGKYDAQDNPMYAIQAAQTMTLVSTLEHLKKPAKKLGVQ